MPRKQKNFKYTAKELLIADFEYKRLVEEAENMRLKIHEIQGSVGSCNELYAYKEGLYRVKVDNWAYKITKIADKSEVITSIV